MEILVAIAPILIGGLIAVVVVVLVRRFQRKRRELARRVAAAAGLACDAETKSPPPYRFDLFNSGHSRKVSYHMWPPGVNDGVFRYQYTTGSGKNSHTYRYTCVLIEVPFNAPHLEIGPEGFWSKIGKALGVRDIEIESEDFNRTYRVSSDDERFAVTLLDQNMIAWMLSPVSGRGTIRFEFLHNALLCISDQLDIEEMPGFLGWAQQIRHHLPAVLGNLYPLARR